ncbi:MAG TPA: carboxypeptidase-like regulatory domain-containing protein [Candidatus Brocadiia bacterium]|nr:carboxypeptidase-like regulatory domain-containing protein [Candidatus Brocadiales bacterium]
MKRILVISGILLMVHSLTSYNVFSSEIGTVTSASATASRTQAIIYGTVREFTPGCWMVSGINYNTSNYEYYELSGGDSELYVYGQKAYVIGSTGATNCTGVMEVLEVESYTIVSACPCDPESYASCLSGRVTNRKGEPLEGMTVTLKGGHMGGEQIRRRTRTDEDGCYYFSGLDGSYRVRVRDCERGGRKGVSVPFRWKVNDVNFKCR